MPTEDSSEGLFISPLLPYAQIIKTFLMTVFSFQKIHITLKPRGAILNKLQKLKVSYTHTRINKLTCQNLIPYEELNV